MLSHLFDAQRARLALIWLCVMVPVTWSEPSLPPPAGPAKPKRPRSAEPQPFAGLTHKPHGALWDPETGAPAPAPPPRPAPRPPPHRHPRTVDPSGHCCPHPGCDSRGWGGLGNLRAHGPPSGGPGRHCHCTACKEYVPAPHGTLVHGQRVAVDRIVHGSGGRAAGLGMRGTARGCAVAPNTVRHCLRAAAEPGRAGAPSGLHALHLTQGHLDALYAVLRALKEGPGSEEGASERLSRSPPWGGAALAPASKVRLPMDVGERRVALAQRVGHQVGQGLAPDGVPLCLSDGFKAYRTAGRTP